MVYHLTPRILWPSVIFSSADIDSFHGTWLNITSKGQEASLLAVPLHAKNASNTEEPLHGVLPPVASERYKKRLDLVGLQECMNLQTRNGRVRALFGHSTF